MYYKLSMNSLYIILQLAVSNITRTDNPMILRFIPTDTIAYNMELLSSNGTTIG